MDATSSNPNSSRQNPFGPTYTIDYELLDSITTRRRWLILLAIGLIAAVEISNRIGINVILPDMQGNVAADADEISWVLILYNIGFISSMALTAAVSRYLGARRHFLFSVGIYSAGAIGCFLSSHNLAALLLSRAVMGFGGGGFFIRMIVISLVFFPGASRLVPFLYTLALLGVLQVFYPTAMGAITDAIHWNYAFLLDFPFLAIGTFVVWKYLPPGHFRIATSKNRLDLRGALLLIASMVSLQTALSRGERDMWLDSPLISIFLVLGLILFVLFVLWEIHPANDVPVLHLRRVWLNRPLRASFALALALGAVLGTALFVLPLYLRNVQSFSATQTGAFFSMYGAGLGIGLVFNLGIAMPRLGALRVAVLGFTVLLLVFVTCVYLWTPQTPTCLLYVITFVEGCGIALTLFGVASLATSQLSTDTMSETYTTFYFVRQFGNSLGVTAATVLFDRRLTLHSSRLLDTANRLDPTAQSYLATLSSVVARNGGAASTPTLGALQIFQDSVVTQTQLLSFVDISFCLAVLCLICLLLALATQRNVRKSLQHFHLW